MIIFISILLGFLVASCSFLLLYNLRTKIGLAPLFMLVGAIHFFQSNFSNLFSAKILDDVIIYPISSILFVSILFTVLLIYVKEGIGSTKAIITGVVVTNLMMSLLVLFINLYQSNNLTSELIFNINLKSVFINTFLALVELLMLVILYQALINRLKKTSLIFVLILSLLAVSIFHTVLYNVIYNFNNSAFTTLITSHTIANSILALGYGILLYFYLKYFDKRKSHFKFISNKKIDIFSILKFNYTIDNQYVKNEYDNQKIFFDIKSTLNNISDGFISLDSNWYYTYINKKAADLLGRTPEDLIGKHIWTEFPEGIGRSFYNAYYKAVETQETIYFKDYYEPLDKWFENRVYPTKDGISIYFRDISEKIQADCYSHMLGSLINSSEQFIGLASLEGKPFYLNANGRSLVGLDENEALPETIYQFYPSNYKKEVEIEQMSTVYNSEKWTGETHFVHSKTNQLISVEVSRFLIRDSNSNSPIALGVVATDITKCKASENAILDMQQKMQAAIRIGNIGHWSWDIPKDEVYWSDFMYEIYDVSRDIGIEYNTASNSVHPDDKKAYNEISAQRIETKSKKPFEYRIICSDNTIKHVMVQMEVIENESGVPIKFHGTVIDITERKVAEEKLAKSESLFRELTSKAPVGIFQTKVDGSCSYANDKWLHHAGLTYNEAMGYGWADAIHPEDRERIEVEWQEYMASDKFELETNFRFLHKNEDVIWVSVKTVGTFDAENNLNGYIGMTIDVTENKQSEEKLINSELLFRSLTTNAPVGIFQTDTEGYCNFVNEEWIKFSGISFNDAMGFGWSNALHPDDKERIIKIWEYSIKNNEVYKVDLRFLNKKENKTYWLSAKSEGIYDANNKLSGFIGVLVDITERKEAEGKLKANEAYLDNILNNIGDPVFVKDNQNRIILANDAFCTIYNTSKEDVLGTTLVEKFPVDARNRALSNDEKVIETGIEHVQEETLNLNNIEVRSISTKKTRFIDYEENKYIIGVVRDITERRKNENAIIDMQAKIEAAIRIGKIGYWSWDVVKDEMFWSDLIYDIYDVDKDTKLKYDTVLSRIHPDDRAYHDKITENKVTNNNSEPYEYRVLCRDNSIKYVIVYMEVVTDENGDPIRYQGTVMDITEKKKAELDLIDSEKLFRQLISNAPAAIFQADREGLCNYVNQEWLDYSGETFENVMGYGWTNAIHPEDKETAIDTWKKGVLAKEDLTFEFRLITPKGDIVWLSNKAIRTFDSNNEFNGYIGVSLDVTDSKKAEEIETKNRQFLNNIINNISDPIFVKDDQNKLILVNNALCTIFGYPKEEILGKTMLDKIPVKERDKLIEVEREIIEKGTEILYEETFSISNKEPRTYSINKKRYIDVDNNKLIIGVLRDITDRKKDEEEIRKAHQRLTTHLNNSPLAVIEWDSNFNITNWSVQAKNIFGWEEQEIIGKHFTEINLIYEEDRALINKYYEELKYGKVKFNRVINRNNTKNQKVIYCEWYNSVLLAPNGEIESFLSMVQDVTERIEIEKSITESEEKFSKVFHSSLIGYSIINTDHVRVDVNETMAKILETTRDQLIGKTMEEAQVEVLDDAYYEQKNRLLDKLLKNGFLYNESIDRTLNSGKKISLLMSVEGIEIGGETHALFAVIDNTEKKITELELESYRNNLEELVEIRTEEVNSKNIQLERMNKLFIGRELKMRDLKNIIKDLRNKYE